MHGAECRKVQSMKLPVVFSSGIVDKDNASLKQRVTTPTGGLPSTEAHQSLGVYTLVGSVTQT